MVPFFCRLLETILRNVLWAVFEDTRFCGAVSDREGPELGPVPLHHPGWGCCPEPRAGISHSQEEAQEIGSSDGSQQGGDIWV